MEFFSKHNFLFVECFSRNIAFFFATFTFSHDNLISKLLDFSFLRLDSHFTMFFSPVEKCYSFVAIQGFAFNVFL